MSRVFLPVRKVTSFATLYVKFDREGEKWNKSLWAKWNFKIFYWRGNLCHASLPLSILARRFTSRYGAFSFWFRVRWPFWTWSIPDVGWRLSKCYGVHRIWELRSHPSLPKLMYIIIEGGTNNLKFNTSLTLFSWKVFTQSISKPLLRVEPG